MCEACWIGREAKWEWQDELGGEVMTELRFPVRLTEPRLERCAWCGSPTIFGVYVRANPDSVAFPATSS